MQEDAARSEDIEGPTTVDKVMSNKKIQDVAETNQCKWKKTEKQTGGTQADQKQTVREGIQEPLRKQTRGGTHVPKHKQPRTGTEYPREEITVMKKNCRKNMRTSTTFLKRSGSTGMKRLQERLGELIN